jgi:outer membrane protein
MKTVFITALFFFFSAMSLYAEDVVKIGIVDLQKIFEESSAGKLVRNEITKKGKEMEADLKSKGGEIEELKKKLDREAAVMSREQRETKEREIEIKILDIKRLKGRYNDELLKLQNTKLESMKKDIFEVVQDIGKKGGYLLIIEKLGVLYSPNTIDITDELIKQYNDRFAKK